MTTVKMELDFNRPLVALKSTRFEKPSVAETSIN